MEEPNNIDDALLASNIDLVTYAASLLQDGSVVLDEDGDVAGLVYCVESQWSAADVDDCRDLLRRLLSSRGPNALSEWMDEMSRWESKQKAQDALVEPPDYVWTITFRITVDPTVVSDGFNPTSPERNRNGFEMMSYIAKSSMSWGEGWINIETMKAEGPDLGRILTEQGFDSETIDKFIAAIADPERSHDG
jgi:hypothetical protein